jgi:hypothetical protein
VRELLFACCYCSYSYVRVYVLVCVRFSVYACVFTQVCILMPCTSTTRRAFDLDGKLCHRIAFQVGNGDFLHKRCAVIQDLETLGVGRQVHGQPHVLCVRVCVCVCVCVCMYVFVCAFGFI